MQADMAGDDDIEPVEVDASRAEERLARNDSISCELGIRYPVLQAVLWTQKAPESDGGCTYYNMKYDLSNI